MSPTTDHDWNPGAYDRFRGLRLRPAIDLLAQVPDVPGGDIVDLGCGSGAAAGELRLRWPERRLIGVDTSAAMKAEAAKTGSYDRLDQADIALWTPHEAPALIFSNAALHWLGDHATLLPRLAGMLASGGTLAVQMPHQNNAPSHRVWLSLAEEYFPGRVDMTAGPAALKPAEYHRLLSPLGRFTLWETDYYQQLAPCPDGHPVRKFTEATYGRPVLDVLEPGEQAQLIAAYEAVMDKAYPRSADGSVLFPFRRLFFTLVV